jgi:hypothetical protein
MERELAEEFHDFEYSRHEYRGSVSQDDDPILNICAQFFIFTAIDQLLQSLTFVRELEEAVELCFELSFQ